LPIHDKRNNPSDFAENGLFHRFMIKILLLLIAGGFGMVFSARHLRRNWREYRGKPKGSVKAWDLVFNYGLSFLWFAYLFVFFAGLIVNNLIVK
jgi:hypothetical protein